MMGRFLALAVVILGALPTAALAACPDARVLRLSGDFATAVQTGQTCLADQPGDVATRLELARSLAALERYAEALGQLDAVLQVRPEDSAVHLLRSRVLAWSGRLEAGWTVLESLPVSTFEDPEAARFRADLAFWRHDWLTAIAAYDRVVAETPDARPARRNRAIARWRSGDVERARRELRRLCAPPASDPDACAVIEDLRETAIRFEVLIQPGIEGVQGGAAGGSLRTRLEARVWRQVRLGTMIYALNRTFGEGTDKIAGTDLQWEFFGSFRLPVGFLFHAALGFSGDPVFSPNWNLKVESGWAFGFGLEVRAMYWRIHFAQGGAHVVSPAVSQYVGPVFLSVRYYLSFDDDRGPGHAVVGRVRWTFVPRWSVSVVGGGGDRSDYLDARREELDSFWLLGAGIAWEPISAIRVGLDYEFRGERAGEQRRRSHLFLLGWRFRF
jgi:tetratricopeptide (TPR) repeat protein